jgi:hypothetical protein
MAFRAYAYLVSILAFCLMMIGALASAFVVSVRLGTTRNVVPDAIVGIICFTVAYFGFFLIVRILKCPLCGHRFGAQNYGGFLTRNLIPIPDCPHCRAYMFGGSSARRNLRSPD